MSSSEQRMLGAVPGEPALGRGPAAGDDYSRHEYHHPAAGWGAARSVARVLGRAGEPVEGFRALFVMNQEDGGFDCPGCAWPDDPNGLHLDICENGVTSFSRDGTRRTVHGYRAVRYDLPPGCAAGYMPELNVLCGIADVSTQSEQPVTKHLVVDVAPAGERAGT
jgi:hypothetical protein